MVTEVSSNYINYSQIYHSNNYGAFRFIREVEPRKHNGATERMAEIEFIQTGTRMTVLVRDAMRGAIKDPYFPKIYGVACVGRTYTTGDHRRFYGIWKSMITRCYDVNSSKHKFYTNCSVCPRWLCFENFIQDVPYLPGYQEMMNNPDAQYSIDKDILQKGVTHKVYSPQTCMFITMYENRLQAILDHADEKLNRYHGVVYTKGLYKVQSTVRNFAGGPVGCFDNEQAAATMREFYREMTSARALPNEDFEPMDIEEALKHKHYKKKPRQLYTLVDVDETI